MQVIGYICHEEDQQRQVPHIQAEGDESNPAQGSPFKGTSKRRSPKEDGKNAQAEARRKTYLTEPVKLSLERLQERPRGVSQIKTPHGKEDEYYNASAPQPGSQALRYGVKFSSGGNL